MLHSFGDDTEFSNIYYCSIISIDNTLIMVLSLAIFISVVLLVLIILFMPVTSDFDVGDQFSNSVTQDKHAQAHKHSCTHTHTYTRARAQTHTYTHKYTHASIIAIRNAGEGAANLLAARLNNLQRYAVSFFIRSFVFSIFFNNE